VAALLMLGAARTSRAADYDVGPGLAYETIGAVPWGSLQPGDDVLIHWRAAPYQEKWVICVRGTAEAPITVKGIAGPQGQLPVIDGQDAVTAPGQPFWNEARGVIKIGGATQTPDLLPGYIVIDGLEVRSGRPPFTFTALDGTTQTYKDDAAAIYVEKAEHLTIRSNDLHDSGNGLFVGTVDGQTQDVLVQANHIHDNGIEGSDLYHNSYTEAGGITFELNRYGPLRPGAFGNGIKDRSAGTVVRYNWIEGGNRELDLVEPEATTAFVDDPRYRTTFVYGNVLVEHDTADNSQILQYGGDNGNEAIYRKGTLYLYDNTVVSERAGHTTLLRLSTNDEHADVRNNLVYVTTDGSNLAVIDDEGMVTLRNNWLKADWVGTHNVVQGAMDDDGTTVTGLDPGFADWNSQDYRLAQGSACIDAGAALDPAVLPDNALTSEYVPDQRSEPRPTDGPLDIGAFECGPGHCPVEAGGGPPGGGGGGGGGSSVSSTDPGASLNACGCRLGCPAAAARPGEGAGSRGVSASWLAALGVLALRARRRSARG
jgi:hypothetical protein